MKRLTTYLIISLSILTLISCSSDKGSGGGDPPPPADNISVSKTNISLSYVMTAPGPATQTITMQNKSTDSISCRFINSSDWVEIDKDYLMLAPSASSVFDIKFKLKSDMQGDYADTIKIYDPISDRVEKKIYVYLTITPDTTGIRILNNITTSDFIEETTINNTLYNVYDIDMQWTLNPYTNTGNTFKITKYEFHGSIYIYTEHFEDLYLNSGDLKSDQAELTLITNVPIGSEFEYEMRVYFEIQGVEDYRAFLISFVLLDN